MSAFKLIYFLLYSCRYTPGIISFILATETEKIYKENSYSYTNIGQLEKGKMIVTIAILINLVIVGTISWTQLTICWEAWSDEFGRKWNTGIENNGGY